MSWKVPEPSVTSSKEEGKIHIYIIEQLPSKESSFEESVESVESVESFVIARNAP